MSVWLVLTPTLAWLTGGVWGISILRRPAESHWRDMQITTATRPLPRSAQPWFGRAMKLFGIALIFMPIVLTIMALLVAAGVVHPASN